MKKIILCWTSDNGYDWLEKETRLDLNNYRTVIDEYYNETKEQAHALSDKWELNGTPDPLFLNFKSTDIHSSLPILINRYMDDIR